MTLYLLLLFEGNRVRVHYPRESRTEIVFLSKIRFLVLPTYT